MNTRISSINNINNINDIKIFDVLKNIENKKKFNNKKINHYEKSYSIIYYCLDNSY